MSVCERRPCGPSTRVEDYRLTNTRGVACRVGARAQAVLQKSSAQPTMNTHSASDRRRVPRVARLARFARDQTRGELDAKSRRLSLFLPARERYGCASYLSGLPSDTTHR